MSRSLFVALCLLTHVAWAANTPTDTPVPPTATDTPAPPTATFTDTPKKPTDTPTDTPTATPTATATFTPTVFAVLRTVPIEIPTPKPLFTEVVEKRTWNQKFYKREDGPLYVMRSFLNPVHRKAQDGSLQDAYFGFTQEGSSYVASGMRYPVVIASTASGWVMRIFKDETKTKGDGFILGYAITIDGNTVNFTKDGIPCQITLTIKGPQLTCTIDSKKGLKSLKFKHLGIGTLEKLSKKETGRVESGYLLISQPVLTTVSGTDVSALATYDTDANDNLVITTDDSSLKDADFPLKLDPTFRILGDVLDWGQSAKSADQGGGGGEVGFSCAPLGAPYGVTTFSNTSLVGVEGVPQYCYGYRHMLQFDVSGIPTGATILSAPPNNPIIYFQKAAANIVDMSPDNLLIVDPYAEFPHPIPNAQAYTTAWDNCSIGTVDVALTFNASGYPFSTIFADQWTGYNLSHVSRLQALGPNSPNTPSWISYCMMSANDYLGDYPTGPTQKNYISVYQNANITPTQTPPNFVQPARQPYLEVVYSMATATPTATPIFTNTPIPIDWCCEGTVQCWNGPINCSQGTTAYGNALCAVGGKCATWTPVPLATNTPTATPVATNTPTPTTTNIPVGYCCRRPSSYCSDGPTNCGQWTPIPNAICWDFDCATRTPIPASTFTPTFTPTNTPIPTSTYTPLPSGWCCQNIGSCAQGPVDCAMTPYVVRDCVAGICRTYTPVPNATATPTFTASNTPIPTNTPTATNTIPATSTPTGVSCQAFDNAHSDFLQHRGQEMMSQRLDGFFNSRQRLCDAGYAVFPTPCPADAGLTTHRAFSSNFIRPNNSGQLIFRIQAEIPFNHYTPIPNATSLEAIIGMVKGDSAKNGASFADWHYAWVVQRNTGDNNWYLLATYAGSQIGSPVVIPMAAGDLYLKIQVTSSGGFSAYAFEYKTGDINSVWINKHNMSDAFITDNLHLQLNMPIPYAEVSDIAFGEGECNAAFWATPTRTPTSVETPTRRPTFTTTPTPTAFSCQAGWQPRTVNAHPDYCENATPGSVAWLTPQNAMFADQQKAQPFLNGTSESSGAQQATQFLWCHGYSELQEIPSQSEIKDIRLRYYAYASNDWDVQEDYYGLTWKSGGGTVTKSTVYSGSYWPMQLDNYDLQLREHAQRPCCGAGTWDSLDLTNRTTLTEASASFGTLLQMRFLGNAVGGPSNVYVDQAGLRVAYCAPPTPTGTTAPTSTPTARNTPTRTVSPTPYVCASGWQYGSITSQPNLCENYEGGFGGTMTWQNPHYAQTNDSYSAFYLSNYMDGVARLGQWLWCHQFPDFVNIPNGATITNITGIYDGIAATNDWDIEEHSYGLTFLPPLQPQSAMLTKWFNTGPGGFDYFGNVGSDQWFNGGHSHQRVPCCDYDTSWQSSDLTNRTTIADPYGLFGWLVRMRTGGTAPNGTTGLYLNRIAVKVDYCAPPTPTSVPTVTNTPGVPTSTPTYLPIKTSTPTPTAFACTGGKTPGSVIAPAGYCENQNTTDSFIAWRTPNNALAKDNAYAINDSRDRANPGDLTSQVAHLYCHTFGLSAIPSDATIQQIIPMWYGMQQSWSDQQVRDSWIMLKYWDGATVTLTSNRAIPQMVWPRDPNLGQMSLSGQGTWAAPLLSNPATLKRGDFGFILSPAVSHAYGSIGVAYVDQALIKVEWCAPPAAAATPTNTPTPTATPQCGLVKCGDVDGNGIQNLDDYDLLASHVDNGAALGCPSWEADINCDAAVNGLDPPLLLQSLTTGIPHISTLCCSGQNTPTPTPRCWNSQEFGLCGDVNGSNTTDDTDLQVLGTAVAGGPTPNCSGWEADINCDTNVNAADLTPLADALNFGPTPIAYLCCRQTPTPTYTPKCDGTLCGDVDGNRVQNVRDANTLSNYLAGGPTPACGGWESNVKCDNSVDGADASLLEQTFLFPDPEIALGSMCCPATATPTETPTPGGPTPTPTPTAGPGCCQCVGTGCVNPWGYHCPPHTPPCEYDPKGTCQQVSP